MKYDIRFAEKELANFFHTNIFNLTNDFKTIGIKKFVDKKYIAEEIANEIYRGFNRPSCVELYSKKTDGINDIKIIMSKIRIDYGNKGINLNYEIVFTAN